MRARMASGALVDEAAVRRLASTLDATCGVFAGIGIIPEF